MVQHVSIHVVSTVMDQLAYLHVHLGLTLMGQFAESVQRSMDIVHRAQVQVFVIRVLGIDLQSVLYA